MKYLSTKITLLKVQLSISLFNKGTEKILGWPKSSFVFFNPMLQKNPSELFSQPSIFSFCHFLFPALKKQKNHLAT